MGKRGQLHSHVTVVKRQELSVLLLDHAAGSGRGESSADFTDFADGGWCPVRLVE